MRRRHGPGARRVRATLGSALACVVLLGGCTSTDEPAPGGTPSVSTSGGATSGGATSEDGEHDGPADDAGGAGGDSQGDDVGSAAPDGTASAVPGDEGDATAAATPCGDSELDGIDATVGGQLAAFAAQDWPAAHAYASSDFRADVDVDGLREIVVDSFPVLAAYAGHDLGTCVRSDTAAQVLVTVIDEAGLTSEIVYTLVRENDAWRIAGAVPHAGVPGQQSDLETA